MAEDNHWKIDAIQQDLHQHHKLIAALYDKNYEDTKELYDKKDEDIMEQ